MWLRWKEARRTKEVSEAAEVAIAEALDIESPAKSGKATWRWIGVKLARIGAASLLLIVAGREVIEARHSGLVGPTVEQALALAFAMLWIWVAAPGKARDAFRGVVGFVDWSGDGIQMVGFVAFYGALSGIMIYDGLTALSSVKWLVDDQRQAIIALLPIVQKGFLLGVAGVTLYQIPKLWLAGGWIEWIVVQCVWFSANLAGWSALLHWYVSAFADRPPDLQSIAFMYFAALCVALLTIGVVANHEYFKNYIKWRVDPVPSTAASPQEAVMPLRPQPNILS